MSSRNALIFVTVLLLSSTTVLADTLKIGLNYPQTGRYKDQGLQQRLGAYLAVDEINQDGGIMGRQVELVIRNTRGEPDQGAKNTAELIDREGVQMVFGGVSSAVAIASGKAAGTATEYISVLSPIPMPQRAARVIVTCSGSPITPG